MTRLSSGSTVPRLVAFSRTAIVLCSVALFSVGGCSRTGLNVYETHGTVLRDGSAPLPDGAIPPLDSADATPPPIVCDPADPSCSDQCVPSEEVCNGIDDDCDGDVDEVAAIPCPGGGFRYCVGGRYSECPKRCEACIPGTERVCFISYCTFWGVQTCSSDGRGFGRCREDPAPRECKHFAKNDQKHELEQCCLDNGYCCVDQFDVDGDGNRREMLGNCDHLSCEP